MHQSENIKIKLITMINKDEYSCLILLCSRVNENQIVEPRRARPKTCRQGPTHWLKFYEEAVIESEARTAVAQLKSEASPSTMIGLITWHAVYRIMSKLQPILLYRGQTWYFMH